MSSTKDLIARYNLIMDGGGKPLPDEKARLFSELSARADARDRVASDFMYETMRYLRKMGDSA